MLSWYVLFYPFTFNLFVTLYCVYIERIIYLYLLFYSIEKPLPVNKEFFFNVVLVIELKAMCMLGKWSIVHYTPKP
jgi:hypothetical protein